LIEWLKRCNLIRKIDFNSKDQVKSALNIAIQKRIPPMKLETLKNSNLELYNKFYNITKILNSKDINNYVTKF
jgi:hypothetical protein